MLKYIFPLNVYINCVYIKINIYLIALPGESLYLSSTTVKKNPFSTECWTDYSIQLFLLFIQRFAWRLTIDFVHGNSRDVTLKTDRIKDKE